MASEGGSETYSQTLSSSTAIKRVDDEVSTSLHHERSSRSKDNIRSCG